MNVSINSFFDIMNVYENGRTQYFIHHQSVDVHDRMRPRLTDIPNAIGGFAIFTTLDRWIGDSSTRVECAGGAAHLLG